MTNNIGSIREERWVLAALAAVVVITAAWWALALWPSHPSSPAWLLRTQSVCFGVKPDGLPDAAGWTGLIASPLGMLLLLFASGRAAFERIMRRLRDSIPLRSYFLLLLVFTLSGATLAFARVRKVSDTGTPGASRPIPSTLSLVDHKAPPLSLIDQSGATIDIRQFKGREVIVTFAYAHCETVCPVIVHNALQLLNSRNAGGRATELLIVTLDPVRDTPARLATIASDWEIGNSAHVLSGDPALVSHVLDDWHVARSYDPQNGMVTHSALLYEVDARGIVRLVRS